MISFTKVQEIVRDTHEARPAANSVYYVGCGASQGELYPGKYFLECNAKTLRASMMQANEFVHATPAAVGENAIVIACSLGGTTPETVAAAKKATELGAKVIAITHDGESPLAKASEYVIVHGFEADYAAKVEKMSYEMCIRDSHHPVFWQPADRAGHLPDFRHYRGYGPDASANQHSQPVHRYAAVPGSAGSAVHQQP